MIREGLLYGIARILIGIIRRLPVRWAARLGRWGGAIAWAAAARRRRVALENLRLAFGEELSARERRRLAREHFRRLGENFVCAVRTLFLPPERVPEVLELQGAEKIQPDNPEWGPCRVMAIGHFGNFELYAKAAAWAPQFQFATTYRAFREPSLSRLFQSIRERSGCLYFERRTDAAKLRRAMSSQRLMIGFLSDQHAGKRGVWAPFFGRLCSTTPAPALFALRYHAPLFPAFCFRAGLGKWRIEVGDPIPLRENGRLRTVEAVTADINRAFEEAVRRDPANWFWVHRRWRRPPRNAKRTAAGSAESAPA